jgi:hypothetical protein
MIFKLITGILTDAEQEWFLKAKKNATEGTECTQFFFCVHSVQSVAK